MAPKTVRVCVVGAGPSGLSFLYYVNQIKESISSNIKNPENISVDVVCYEKHATFGGLWNLSWRVGTELGGEVVHSSMYQHLWTNAPKEALEFYDHPFNEHFDVTVPSYLPRVMILDYMKARMMKHGDLNKFIKYDTKVTNVTFDEEKKTFLVQTTSADNIGTPHTEETFDYVIVATGHFWAPNFPEFPGIEKFPGRVLHAHDYKCAKEFKGMRIMVVGGSYSADDIAVQCMKFGATSAAISCRRPTGIKWDRPGFTEYPILTRVEGNTVHFEGGQHIDVDAIILCTGYRHCFPFVHPSLQMTPENVFYPKQLYKGVIYTKGGNNQMMYLGMQNQAFSFPMFDAQALWSLQYILKNITVPCEADMLKHIKIWSQREGEAKSVLDIIDLQNDYVLELHKEAEHEFKNFFEYRNLMKKWIDDKVNKNLFTFRNQTFKSVVTGTQSTSNKTPFMENFDDSMEGIMNQC